MTGADKGETLPPWADLPAYRAAFRARCPLPGSAPAELAGRAQWLLWRYEPGETPQKKPRKMPYYADGGKRFAAQGGESDRKRLVCFKQVLEAASRGDWDGVGFAFLPGDGLIGIDLDGMIDAATGEVSERLSGIVAACASYTELSPSGSGIHTICRVSPELEAAWEADGRKLTFKDNKLGVEVFHGRQYFTFTGVRWGAVESVEEISEKTLRRLYVTVKGDPAKPVPAPAASAPPSASSSPPVGGRTRSVAELVALVEEALGFVDPDDYHQWIHIGMACKADLGAAGYMVWDGWSGRSAKYAGAEDTARRWSGMQPEKWHVGTVFALAEEGGWVSPWAKAKARKGRKPKQHAAPRPAKTDSDATVADAGKGGSVPPSGPDVSPPGGDDPPGGDSGPDDPPPDEDWQQGLIYKKGDVSSCLANAELILSHSPEWEGVVAYDLFAERTVFRRALPFDRRGDPEGEWSDHLDARTAIHMQRQWRVEFSPSTVGQAVEVHARSHRFHPVREALEALPPWDGIRRNTEWLSDFLGVARTEYVALVGKFFLLGMIRRVMEPGCKFDYCLVLEGEQGRGKSTVARILSWHWFCDTDLDLNNKDSLMALPGHWVYEIAELGSLMKAEERKQKSFLSRQEDEYRPPYGKRLIRAPRQCVFIGTTNEEEYLKDATGGRRFWPVMVGEDVNLDGLLAAREQMFAEALHDYRQRERCYPSPEEQARLFTPEQAKRGMPEPFEDFLFGWVDKQAVPFSMAEAAADGLSLTPDKLTPAVVTRLGIVLKRLGCVRIENRTAADPGRRRLYMSPKLAEKARKDPTALAKANAVPAQEEDLNAPF